MKKRHYIVHACKITKKQANFQTICLLFVLGTYKQIVMMNLLVRKV
jgi:hypothetical protein